MEYNVENNPVMSGVFAGSQYNDIRYVSSSDAIFKRLHIVKHLVENRGKIAWALAMGHIVIPHKMERVTDYSYELTEEGLRYWEDVDFSTK